MREQSRIQVLNGVIEGEVTVAEAAVLMGVSERHGWACLVGRQAITGSVQEGTAPWLTGTEGGSQ